MARTAIAVTSMAPNTAIAPAAGTAVDVANGMYVDNGGKIGRLLLIFKNTAAAAKNFTLKAGANPPAFRKDLGDLVVQVPLTNGVRQVMIEGARFAQAAGGTDGGNGSRIFIDLEAGTTGTVEAYDMTGVV